MTIDKANLRIYVVVLVIILWTCGAVFGAITGNLTLLKIVTPFLTIVFGWLFTEQASQ